MAGRLSLRRPVLAALAAFFTLLPAAMPQVTYEVAPYAGLYLPRGSVLLPAAPNDTIWDPYAPKGFVTSVAQRMALAIGGHATAWLAHRLGIDGTLSYAPSGVTYPPRSPGEDRGHVITGSAKIVVSPIVINDIRLFRFGGGVGFVNHGGDAYHGVAGGTRVVPSVGLGIALRVGASRLVRIDADDYLFRLRLSRQGDCNHSNAVCVPLQDLPTMPGFQHDLILSIGLVFRAR